MENPSPSMRFASAAVHLLGASILSYCFAARSGNVLGRGWRQVPWARWCIMLVFIDSWIFHVSAGLLIQGPGLSNNYVSCSMAIYLCITIYCLSKILIYSFLIERVYVVWPHNGTRLSSKAYCICLVTMIGYVVVTTLMIIGRNASLDDDTCIIGLKRFASIPLLSYDLFLNVFLTSMFLWPLQQAHFRDVRLRKIATRTLYAALVALTTSAINITVLTAKQGQEEGWICLLSCGLDVTVNALALYWVTGYRPDDSQNVNYLTTFNFTVPYTGTHSIAVSSARPAELAAPPPAHDKAGTRRLSVPATPELSVPSPTPSPLEWSSGQGLRDDRRGAEAAHVRWWRRMRRQRHAPPGDEEKADGVRCTRCARPVRRWRETKSDRQQP